MIELLVAITIMTVAVGSLLTLFVDSALSLRSAGKQGTAVTLAEDQMEIYRIVGFTRIRLNSSLIPTTGQYVTGHSTNTNIPPSTGQAVGGSNGDASCPDSDYSAACYPVQTIIGPDGYTYTVDTYIDYVDNNSSFSIVTPASGLTLKLVTVVVRDGITGNLLALDSSAFEG